MSRKLAIALGLAAAFAVVLWAQDPALVLKSGGIEFPDGSIQDTAHVAPSTLFVLNSPLHPVKTFSVVREHQYNGTSDPAMPPLQFQQGGLGGLLGVVDDTDQPPNHADPGLDPQFRLGIITPCEGVIGTVNKRFIPPSRRRSSRQV